MPQSQTPESEFEILANKSVFSSLYRAEAVPDPAETPARNTHPLGHSDTHKSSETQDSTSQHNTYWDTPTQPTSFRHAVYRLCPVRQPVSVRHLAVTDNPNTLLLSVVPAHSCAERRKIMALTTFCSSLNPHVPFHGRAHVEESLTLFSG